MKFALEYPVSAQSYDPRLIRGDGLRTLARAAEQAGFAAIGFTEHPAPSMRWMETGGHDTVDPLTALAFCAAVTKRIELMPYALILPYYNAFMAAKQLASLDRFSDGRLVLVAGTGYLKSEFLALGQNIEERNARFDEALEAMRAAWTQAPCNYEGAHFTGRGFVQSPMCDRVPPILIAGNSRLARRRAAAHDGWSPLLISSQFSDLVRTAPLESIDALAAGIREVCDLAGDRAGKLSFQVETDQNTFLESGRSVEEHRDHLGRLAEAGIDRFIVKVPANSAEHAADALMHYGETFIAAASG
ncbi:MAG: TIGR03619 family F420-dependent LLM class oxidoreductase [Sphingomonadaceae bacterium]|nr:TIGR03619 family F420-dependent LLM class oxidoreductase [Sphingomonadaceae bacterium]